MAARLVLVSVALLLTLAAVTLLPLFGVLPPVPDTGKTRPGGVLPVGAVALSALLLGLWLGLAARAGATRAARKLAGRLAEDVAERDRTIAELRRYVTELRQDLEAARRPVFTWPIDDPPEVPDGPGEPTWNGAA